MKSVNLLRNAIRIVVLTVLLCILPIFVKDVSALSLPTGIRITNASEEPAVEDVDYEFDGEKLTINTDALTIDGDGSTLEACIEDKISNQWTHLITIKNITITDDSGTALYVTDLLNCL